MLIVGIVYWSVGGIQCFSVPRFHMLVFQCSLFPYVDEIERGISTEPAREKYDKLFFIGGGNFKKKSPVLRKHNTHVRTSRGGGVPGMRASNLCLHATRCLMDTPDVSTRFGIEQKKKRAPVM